MKVKQLPKKLKTNVTITDAETIKAIDDIMNDPDKGMNYAATVIAWATTKGLKSIGAIK